MPSSFALVTQISNLTESAVRMRRADAE
jgi:hypothetical protein